MIDKCTKFLSKLELDKTFFKKCFKHAYNNHKFSIIETDAEAVLYLSDLIFFNEESSLFVNRNTIINFNKNCNAKCISDVAIYEDTKLYSSLYKRKIPIYAHIKENIGILNTILLDGMYLILNIKN